MKKFLVIKVLNVFSPTVESSFDDLNDAKKYASLCKKACDNKYDFVVAGLLQAKSWGELSNTSTSLNTQPCLLDILAQQLINKFSLKTRLNKLS